MKRFLIGAVALFLLAVGSWTAIYRHGFYLDLHPNAPVSPLFRTEGKKLLRQADDGTWESFRLRSVDVSASLPGHPFSDFSPTEEDYLRWFQAIGEMGANTVRITTIMDDDFYNALYSYNTTHKAPLYLLQGIQVSDAANQGSADAYDLDFLGRLLADGQNAVDVIHGRKSVSADSLWGSGHYRKDVSPWVVGFLVGHEWDSRTVAYTDHSLVRSGAYQGRYFTTAPEATPFEAMLAQVMDAIVDYESGKYKEQRLLSFINDPANDPFAYDPFFAAQLAKYNQLDAERILPTDELRSGYFASYSLYDFCPDFPDYLAPEQIAALGWRMVGLDRGAPYGGYLELLRRYHTMPLVATYGVSSARGAIDQGKPPLTEQEQGEAIAQIYEEAMSQDWAGVSLSTWQDSWERRTWNTAFATDLTRNYLWHDVQTDGQNYGLMAFDPGETERVCVLDGSASEWTEDNVVFTGSRWTISARYDSEGLYLLLQGETAANGTPLYLPIDVTDKSGSSRLGISGPAFERPADFVLRLNGADNTRLLVQERYDATRENFLFEIKRRDPFTIVPDADGTVFSVVTMALSNKTLAPKGPYSSWTELRSLRALGSWDTGRLTHGNGDPDAADYNSLADFCYGVDCVELRLPWALLNFSSPPTMMVHADYYEHYGVENLPIREIWLGVGDGRETIPMFPVPLKGWGNKVRYHERLKESYDVLQKLWTAEVTP